MEGSVLSFRKAEWKVSDTGSAHWASSFFFFVNIYLYFILFQRMKGNEILKFLVEDEKRLAKPEFCDDQVYSIMLMCWEYE